MAGLTPKALMRHKSISTTEKHYLDAEALQAEAVNLIPVSEIVRRVVG